MVTTIPTENWLNLQIKVYRFQKFKRFFGKSISAQNIFKNFKFKTRIKFCSAIYCIEENIKTNYYYFFEQIDLF